MVLDRDSLVRFSEVEFRSTRFMHAIEGRESSKMVMEKLDRRTELTGRYEISKTRVYQGTALTIFMMTVFVAMLNGHRTMKAKVESDCNMPYWGKDCDKTFAKVMGRGWYVFVQFIFSAFAGFVAGLFLGAYFHIRRRKNILRTISVYGLVASVTCCIQALDPLCWDDFYSCHTVEVFQGIQICAILTILVVLSFQWIAIDHANINANALMRVRNVFVVVLWSSIMMLRSARFLQTQANVAWHLVSSTVQASAFLAISCVGFFSFWRLLSRMESENIQFISMKAQVSKRMRILSYMCGFMVMSSGIIVCYIATMANEVSLRPVSVPLPPTTLALVLASVSDKFIVLTYLLVLALFLWNSDGVSGKSNVNLNGDAAC